MQIRYRINAHLASTCNCFPATDNPHVSIIPSEDELATDAHVQTGYNHNHTWYQAPEHQEIKGSKQKDI